MEKKILTVYPFKDTLKHEKASAFKYRTSMQFFVRYEDGSNDMKEFYVLGNNQKENILDLFCLHMGRQNERTRELFDNV